MKLRGLLFCTLALLATASAYKSYTGYQVLETIPLDKSALLNLQPLLNRPEFDFWSRPHVGGSVKIMAGPEHVEELKNILSLLNLEPSVLIPDVEVTIQKERAENEFIKRHEKPSGRAPILDRFLEYDEIDAYLDEVVTAYPEIASLIEIGASYEGRPMRVLKLSNGPGKSGMFFDAAIHAREWLTPPVILYTINELTENLAANQAMLDKNDFYFLPVANPDGYVFSWSDTRLWRKTRSPNSGSNCVGTDPNRNFDYAWAGGGIPSPCDDTYPGSSAFSESETQAIRDFFVSNPSVTFYVTIHSYGQYLLYPWGDTYQLPPNGAELQNLGNDATDALFAINSTPYQVGSIANVLYFAYGGSIDWTLGAQDVMFSYAFELPGGGSAGFNPPPSDILPVATETWEAIKVFADNIPDSRGK